jgi:hypothetical protein
MNRRVLINFSEQLIQTPLITKLCSGWNENDRIYAFSTRIQQPVSTLTNWTLSVPVEQVVIPQKEIRKVFNTIYGVLKEEDEVYIDIPFCPRIVEMLIIFLLQHVWVLKNIKVKGYALPPMEKLILKQNKHSSKHNTTYKEFYY